MKREYDVDDEEVTDALFCAELNGIRDVEIKTIREWLERDGFRVVPSPPDESLSEHLHLLIDRLADMNVLVRSTDHLSDRELYAFLIGQMGGHISLFPDSFVFLDVIGGGSAEDNDIYLRYYATEKDRAWWIEEFPHSVIPPREKPPHDRDRLLP
jgi:hypothetical protein